MNEAVERELFIPRVYSVPCYDSIDERGEKHRVSAIIAPIRLKWKNDTLMISWGCSKVACQNKSCRYSKAFAEEFEAGSESIQKL
jgi:hypothetical protein